MLNSPKYQSVQIVHHFNGVVLYRAKRKSDNKFFLLKVLDAKTNASQKLEHLKRELKIGKELDTASVLKPLAVETSEGVFILVMEDFSGLPLELVFQKTPDLETFLKIAINIAGGLKEIHQKKFIHKDIRPRNILVNTTTFEVKITGLEYASFIQREKLTNHSSQTIEGSFAYMSPEQTGRVNQSIDHRSDLYSLGMTFYEMIAGQPAFEAKDPLEWVHSHITKNPASPSTLNSSIPESVSEIILTLLSKSVDDRYQTASGLIHDLENCLNQWESQRDISPFPLKRKDVSQNFLLPRRLYGREQEVKELIGAFKRVTNKGVSELAMISGHPGSGKSSLVNEIQPVVSEMKGFFISGEFQQFKKDAPFSNIAYAFNDLILFILSMNERDMNEWAQRLRSSMGSEGKALVEVLPQLELLIGPQPTLPQLPLNEAQNRFRRVFKSFVKEFGKREHPLVMFLDDLQWSDTSSLSLLVELVSDEEICFLYLICSYRDNEVTADHPLLPVLSELQKTDARLTEIKLAPLTLSEVTSFISDTLGRSFKDVAPIASLTHQKTLGNPFFIIQFLLTLKEEDMIFFDESVERWDWDIDKIKSQGFTDNVVDFIIRKIQKLPLDTQNLLKQLSYLGTRSKIDDLVKIYRSSKEEVETGLWEALKQGIICKPNESYKFTHDRLHESVYNLIPAPVRLEEHERIGLALLADLSAKELEQRVFEVAGHFNKAVDFIQDDSIRRRIIALNLMAAQRARAETAFSVAVTYCEVGLSMLDSDAWEKQYNEISSLSIILVECLFVIGKTEQAEELIESLFGKVKTRQDLIQLRQVQINLYSIKGHSMKALQSAFDGLSLFGIALTAHPEPEGVKNFEATMRDRISELGYKKVLDLHLMENREVELALEVLLDILPSAYYTDSNLHLAVCCNVIDLTLRYGIAPSSPMGFAAYAFDLIAQGRYEEMKPYKLITEKLMERHNFIVCKPKVFDLLGATIIPWTDSYSKAIQLLKRGSSSEGGDMLFTSLCKIYEVWIPIHAGYNLQRIDRSAELAIAFVRKRKVEYMPFNIILMRRFIKVLEGKTFAPGSFGSQDFDETKFLEDLFKQPLALTKAIYYVFKMQLSVFYGDYTSALSFSEKCESVIFHLRGQQSEMEFTFFYALAIAGCWNRLKEEGADEWMNKLKGFRQKLSIWAGNNPPNFESRHALINAEVLKIEKREMEAQRAFEASIRSAKVNRLIQVEALASERTAKYYQEREFELISKSYVKESRRCYLEWGAYGVARKIEDAYPSLVESHSLSSMSAKLRPEDIDLLSAIKASQVISSNIDQEKLILSLMEVLLEQSGAQHVSFILNHQGRLRLKAQSKMEANGIETNILTEDVSLETQLPLSILNFIQRTKQEVILEDASHVSSRFSSDPYIVSKEPKSVLALPILREGSLQAIIYLENKTIKGIFSVSHLSVLKLLAAQASISLQNAQYYQSLKEENKQRQTAEEALRVSQERLQSIIDSTTSVIYVKDLEGRFLLVNKSFESVFHLDRKNIIGKTDMDIFPVDVAEKLRKNDQITIKTTSPIEHEEVVPQDDGLHTYLSVKFPLHDAKGRAYAICGVSTDITDRKKVEDEKEKLLRDAQRSIEARDDFISIASHELRTPLTPMKLFLDMLKIAIQDIPEGSIPNMQSLSLALKQCSNAFNKLAKLTEDLLDVSKITIDRFELKLETVSLSRIIKDTVKKYSDELKRSGSELKVTIEEDLEGTWDKVRIREVMENLLSNAIKYGNSRPIQILVEKTGEEAQLSVKDHGIGIPEEDQGKIFELFEKTASITHYGGLGLGLYISKKIIAAHRGSICVKSRLGQGSTFIVKLPTNSLPQKSKEE